MTSNNQSNMMLSDALDRVAANPTASHLWLNLMQLIRGISSAELLAGVVRAIAALTPSHGLAGFYRAAVLDLATGDPAFLPQACACLQTITPHDLDRCSAFLDTTWQRALLYANDRTAFIQRLKTIGLPALSLLIGQQVARYAQAGAQAPGPARQIRRVALIAPHLATTAHPPTLMALDQAQTLMQHGVEVSLFSCQEAIIPDAMHLLGTGAGNPQLQPDLQAALGSIASLQVHLADPRVSLLRRWHDMLGKIQTFSPDLVLFVGLHSGLVPMLYPSYPVLGLSTNSIAPLVPTDVWLTAQAALANTVSRPWDEGFPDSMACYHPFRVRRKNVGETLPRASLGVDDDALLLISIGAHLDLKIDGEWAQRMCAAMERHPKLVWILLGGKGKLPPALARLAPERLRLHQHTPQAMQWLAASDLYIHPPIMGGGFSVAEAMSLGIPAIALADADGGDKVGADAVANLDEYFARLDALAGDAALRQACGRRMQAHFDNTLDLAASGPSLLAAGRAAIERHQRRIKPSNA